MGKKGTSKVYGREGSLDIFYLKETSYHANELQIVDKKKINLIS